MKVNTNLRAGDLAVANSSIRQNGGSAVAVLRQSGSGSNSVTGIGALAINVNPQVAVQAFNRTNARA